MKTNMLLITVGFSVLLMTGCAREKPAGITQEKAVCVKTETLIETSNAVPIQCVGLLSSKRLIKLSFKTGGIIARINAEEGSIVKKGQVMASLEMTEISSQVEQALLALQKAERDLSRIKSLYKDTVATLEQLQDATLAYEVALENHHIAAFNQQYSRITASADGKVIAQLAEEHELVGAGTPILVFSEHGKEEWVVKAGLTDKDIVKIRKGDKAEVVFDAFPGKTFPAYVSQMAETVDSQSGTFEIEVTVVPGKERLINGMVAKVFIELASNQSVTLVPPEALIGTDGGKGYVYVVEEADSTAKKIPVTVAYLDNQYVAVHESINELGPVITEGAVYLEDGSKISIQK